MTFDNEFEQQPETTEEIVESCEPECAVEEETQDAVTVPESVAAEPEITVPKRKKGWTGGKVIALTLVCSLLSGILGGAGAILINKYVINGGKGRTTIYEGVREPMELEIEQVGTDKILTPAQVYAANVKATVGIQTSITTNYWGYQTTGAVAGSGFVLTPDGFVGTNYHVVEGATSITVTMHDGTTYGAYVVGYDAKLDFAVLKMDAEGLQPVVLGNSDQLYVGDEIMTIGNPLGELTFSLSVGVISALDREITVSDGSTNAFIQTDCAINSGNSGGAMFNSHGEVVGIATAKYSGETSSGSYIDNIGFAIPINQARSMIEQLIENGYATKPYLGVTVTDVSSQMQNAGRPKGAVVYSVDENGAAAAAGIRPNDIIVAVNGTVIKGFADLSEQLAKCEVGQTITLSVYRNGQTFTTDAVLGEIIVSTEF